MRFLFCVFSFFLLSLTLFSSNYINILFDRSDYHASDKNWGISKDAIGRMYFANDAGLLEYDGVEWKLHELSNNRVIRSVFADQDRIYTGGFEEFGFWDRNTNGALTYHSLSSGLEDGTFSNDDIWNILKYHDCIYFQSFHRLYLYDGTEVRGIDGPSIFSMSVANGDLIVQEIDGALYRLINDEYEKISGSEFLSKYKVQAILPADRNTNVIITSLGDFFVYDGQSFTPMQVAPDLKNKEINNVKIDREGNYCIGTLLDGIYIVSKQGEILSHLNTQNMISNNSILSTYIDEKNNIWGGMAEGIVLLKYSSELDFFIDYKNNIGSVYAASLFEDKLFIGTNVGLFYTRYANVLSDDFSLSQFSKIENIHGQVWDLMVIDDELYCAHNGGLAVVDQALNVSNPYPLRTGVFSILKMKESDDVLLGTYNDLSKINTKSGALIRFEGLREPIKNIQIDHLGNVWLEHLNRGVYKCQINETNDSIENLVYYSSKDKELPYKMSIFKIGERIAFMGNDHFFIYDDLNNTISPMRQTDQLFEHKRDLRNVVNSGKNTFWVLSNNALYELYTNGNQTSFKNKIDLEINDLSLVNNFETIIPINDSIELICLNKGFICYKSKLPYTPYSSNTKPTITSFETIDDQKVYSGKDLRHSISLPFNENSIKVSFFSSESVDGNIYVQYCLEGFDDWSEPASINHLIYDRLADGKYTLAIRAINPLGDISEATTICFAINKHWSKTWWAYVLYVLLAMVLIGIVYYFILLRYRNLHLLKVRERELARLKSKNSKLQMEMRAKDAEMLSQTSSMIQKNELIHQVKEELDSYQEKVDNKSFKPLYNKIKLLLNSTLNSEEDWTNFMFQFELKHPIFFKYLKINYPQLTANDLKLCACLKINLDSKEIASLMNISVRSVENNRSRLRKKIDLQPEQNLNEFIMSI